MTYNYIVANQSAPRTGTGDVTFEAAGVVISGGIDMRYKSDDTTFGGGGSQIMMLNGGLLGGLDDYGGATSGNDQITIGQAGYIATNGIAIELDGGGNAIINNGTIAGGYSGEVIYVIGGSGAAVSSPTTVSNTGVISGSQVAGAPNDNMITLSGVSSLKLVNSGSILAGAGLAAISGYSTGDGSTLFNSGLISGDTSFGGGSLSMVNNGTIEGALNLTGSSNILTNRGSIDGDIVFNGVTKVTNRGDINGSVSLGNSGGLFRGTGGTVTGSISGGTKADTIIAGSDGETLAGGKGHDSLTGGSGADAFVFSSYSSADTDTIHGFNVANDLIQLDHTAFGRLKAGTLPTFAVATKATSKTDYLFYNAATGVLYYDLDGSGTAHKAAAIATLLTGLKLTASDFSVV